MKCTYPNRDNAMDGHCFSDAVWLLQRSMLGYPSNRPVTEAPKPCCSAHAIVLASQAVAEPERHVASIQLIRIEHAKEWRETEARMKGIGR